METSFEQHICEYFPHVDHHCLLINIFICFLPNLRIHLSTKITRASDRTKKGCKIWCKALFLIQHIPRENLRDLNVRVPVCLFLLLASLTSQWFGKSDHYFLPCIPKVFLSRLLQNVRKTSSIHAVYMYKGSTFSSFDHGYTDKLITLLSITS